MSSSRSSSCTPGDRSCCPATDLIALVESVASPFACSARERGISLRIRPDTSIPAKVYIDGDRLREALGEVIDHALARISTGEVRVDLIATPYNHVSNAMRLRIAVIDSGLPIDSSTALARAREHAANLGGHLTISSNESCNGGVTIEFPAEIAPHDAPLAAAPWQAKSLQSVRVLVGDDGTEVRDLLVSTLRNAGAIVAILEPENEALPAVSAAHEQGVPFDAVILDHRSAEGDASVVARALRHHGFEGTLVLFSSVSAALPSGDGSEDHALFQCAFDAVFTRPLGFPNLISDLVFRHQNRSGKSPHPRIPSASAPERTTMRTPLGSSGGSRNERPFHHP